MNDQLYRIKPLKWEGSEPRLDANGEPVGGYRADVPGGSYDISYLYSDYDINYSRSDGKLRWGYCFKENPYWDRTEIDTVEAAKAACEQHWRKRILPALEPVDGAGDSKERP